MNEEQFKEIAEKMNVLIRLMASIVVKDMKTQKEKILYLSSLGFGPTDIARFLGTTSNTVNVALSQSRKKSDSNVDAEKPKESTIPQVDNK